MGMSASGEGGAGIGEQLWAAVNGRRGVGAADGCVRRVWN